MATAVVIPLKGLRAAKGRLAAVLTSDERAEITRCLASGVIRAADPLDVVVVTCDEAAVLMATDLGAHTVDDPGNGLNAAVAMGLEAARRRGATEVIVAHADLAFPEGLAELANVGGVTLVPDRHGDGTNVIALAAHLDFHFAYGPGSFQRHRAEAGRLDVEVTVLADSRLSWDVDTPADLQTPAEWGPPSWRVTGG